MKIKKCLLLFMVLFLFPLVTYASNSNKGKLIELEINGPFSLCSLTTVQEMAFEYLVSQGVIVKRTYSSGGTSASTNNTRTVRGHSTVTSTRGFDILNASGKTLVACDTSQDSRCGICNRADNVTDSDSVTYMFSAEEKAEFAQENSEMGALAFQGYDGISFTFTPTVTNQTDLIYNITDDDRAFELPLSMVERLIESGYDKLKINIHETIKDSQNNILSTYTIQMGDSESLDVDCRTTSDIVYNLTAEDKNTLLNNYNINLSSLDKVVLNYSGNNYDDNTLSIDMRNYSEQSNRYTELLLFLNEKGLINLDVTLSLTDGANTQYAYFLVSDIDLKDDNPISMYATKITIPKTRQIIINVNEINNSSSILPSNYRRIIINLINKRESSNNTTPSSNTGKTITKNPSTNGSIMIVCLLIIFGSGTLFVSNLAKNR